MAVIGPARKRLFFYPAAAAASVCPASLDSRGFGYIRTHSVMVVVVTLIFCPLFGRGG